MSQVVALLTVLPILVTGFGGPGDGEGAEDLNKIAHVIKAVVDESGKSAKWLISGDLAHIGQRFGDPEPARELLPAAERADDELMKMLKDSDADAYHMAVEATGHKFRVCGHAPTYLALKSFSPSSGTVLAYDVWDDIDTNSAVTFASVAFE